MTESDQPKSTAALTISDLGKPQPRESSIAYLESAPHAKTAAIYRAWAQANGDPEVLKRARAE